MSAYIEAYPHFESLVDDKTGANVFQEKPLPNFRPLIVMPAQCGVTNEPVWCQDGVVARNLFGEETFNPANAKYFSPQSEYLNDHFKKGGAFICRAANNKALPAIALLCAAVKINQGIPQWEVDSITGNYKLDAQGAKIPIMTTDQVPVQVTAKGATVRYLMLNDLTTIGTALGITFTVTTDLEKLQQVLAVLTAPDFSANPLSTGADAVIVPLLLVMSKSPGVFGNDLGFRVEYDKVMNSASAVAKKRGFIFNFSPFKKLYGTNNTTTIRSIFGSTSFSAALTAEMIDSSSKVTYDMRSVIQRSYPSESHNLMMDFYPIVPNFNLLAAVVAPYEESIPDLDFKLYETNGSPVADIDAAALQEALGRYQYAGMFNIFGLRDPSGVVYKKIVALPTNDEPGFFNIGTGKFLSLGDDGDIFDKAVFKAYLTSFYDLQINPNLEDSARYPFTHLIDLGFQTDNKFDMLDFMAVRDDIQVLTGPYVHPKFDPDPLATGVSTAEVDISAGAVLRARALTIRESVIKGTNSCRATIFAQAGFKPGGRYPVPLQYWLGLKLAEYDNKVYIDKEVAGLPESAVEIFESIVWVPSPNVLKKLTWDTGLNYCQYYDMKRYHFASIRTVHDNDTSLLSDDGFTRHLVYTKHAVRKIWAKHAGRKTKTVKILQAALEADTIEALRILYNGKYTFSVRAYQTATDSALGYVQRVEIIITSGAPYRVGIFEIVCNRDGYNV